MRLSSVVVTLPCKSDFVSDDEDPYMRLVLMIVALTSLSSCSDLKLPSGYTVRQADRGKAWLRDPDETVLLSHLMGVAQDDPYIFAETRRLSDSPPYGYADCEYFVIDTRARSMRRVNDDNFALKDAIRRRIRDDWTFRSERTCTATDG
jgi:hypothetical protein